MIETLFARASSSARLLEPPLGSYLESLAQTLQGQSYSREVIRSYVYAAHRFGEWLSKQGLPLSAVSDQLISRYIDQFHKRITLAHPYGQRSKLAHGLGHLLAVLRQAGVVVAAKQITSPTEQWLARYDQYLNQVGGKAAATRKKYGVWGVTERNPELGIMQRIFSSASRRETLGKHSKGGRRGGGLKIDWTKPLPRA